MAELALREDIHTTIREYALDIRQTAANRVEIINDILDFSKIENGKADLVQCEYTLSSLIISVLSSKRAGVPDKLKNNRNTV